MNAAMKWCVVFTGPEVLAVGPMYRHDAEEYLSEAINTMGISPDKLSIREFKESEKGETV